MRTPEGAVVARLIKRVRDLGWTQRKLSYEGRRGAPDRLILGPGVHALVEVKAPGRRPAPAQALELARLREAGFDVYVVDSEQAVEEMLLELFRMSALSVEEQKAIKAGGTA